MAVGMVPIALLSIAGALFYASALRLATSDF